eukprot:CAMPEP_0173088390 /NCGR_PEP_ID=MMETSP1102-20130122/24899_1 /TAXON_ID=49646 /ORGANISM="Geminigera sp., Strain Caron Lab Isolate" /LENGTH=78 /DNA_ID=CAMNT_0013971271 /DNA_START=591 /DNA_END=823 /DNA_ORIENTATION=-
MPCESVMPVWPIIGTSHVNGGKGCHTTAAWVPVAAKVDWDFAVERFIPSRLNVGTASPSGAAAVSQGDGVRVSCATPF